MTSNFDVRELGVHLGVSAHKTKAIANSVSDPQFAALDMLEVWRDTVATAEEAYKVLRRALLDTDHSSIVAEVLTKPK